MSNPDCILLTGASGAVGTDLAAKLVHEKVGVIALLHNTRELIQSNGTPLLVGGPFPSAPKPGEIRYLIGDVTKPKLGLSADLYNDVARAASMIIHAAALTDFGRPPQIYEEINLNGTRHVLELAQQSPTRLVHISTVVVCGQRDGQVMEDDLNVGQTFANPYEKTKLKAEQLVRDARKGGLQAAIVRPSVVVGAERTGRVRDFQNIYVVLKVLTEGGVKTIPGHYDACLDLVPVDYVVDVIAEVVERFDAAEGMTFHAVNGTPLTLRNVSDVLAEYPPFHAPRFVPPQNFDRDALPKIERKYYEGIVSLYDSYFQRRAVFDNRNTASFVARRPPSSAKPFFRRMLDYCLRVEYLGSALPNAGSVVASIAQSDRLDRPGESSGSLRSASG
jgi:thioester reductase-like protein